MAITFDFATYYALIDENPAAEISTTQTARATTISNHLRRIIEERFTGKWDERDVTYQISGDDTSYIRLYGAPLVTAITEIRLNGTALDESTNWAFDKKSQMVWRADGELWTLPDSDTYTYSKPDCNVEIDCTLGWADNEAIDADVPWRNYWTQLTAMQTVNRLRMQNDDPQNRMIVDLNMIGKYFGYERRRK